MLTERVWLMKSEPDEFSFADLRTQGRTRWTGVRNYLARNFMMKEMQVGDLVLFYHSNAEPSGVAGLGFVACPSGVDESAFDKKSDYFDEKSSPDKPRWFCVDVGYKADLPRFISLDEIKKNKRLAKMVLLQNSRLSVQPVTREEAAEILKMAGAK